MNRELINRVADQIEAHPENLFMDDWAASEIEVCHSPSNLGGGCGTAACAAGWILIESGYTPIYFEDPSSRQSSLTGEHVYRRRLEAWRSPNGTIYDSYKTADLACAEIGVMEFDLPLDNDWGRLFYWYAARPETIVAALRQLANRPDPV